MAGAVLVTGAAGFAAGHLLSLLRREGPVEGWYRPGVPPPPGAPTAGARRELARRRPARCAGGRQRDRATATGGGLPPRRRGQPGRGVGQHRRRAGTECARDPRPAACGRAAHAARARARHDVSGRLRRIRRAAARGLARGPGDALWRQQAGPGDGRLAGRSPRASRCPRRPALQSHRAGAGPRASSRRRSRANWRASRRGSSRGRCGWATSRHAAICATCATRCAPIAC